jgi:glycosyltransferase involved in cell wall biosynthesis
MPDTATRTPDLSVVIPCLNAAQELPAQLDALAQQVWSGSWEVVIADNGSTDATARVAESYADRLPGIRVVDAGTRRGRHHACNVGAAHAAGRAIVFVDADDEVHPGYLAAMAGALAQGPVVAARLDHTRDPDWMQGVGGDVQTSGLQNGLGFLPFGCGASLGFRKLTFDAIGGFREHATLCEDVDICWRAQLAGNDITFVDDAVITYRARPTIRQMYRQHRNYARSWPLLYREFRPAGMPRRETREALAEWGTMLRSVPRLRSRTESARWARRLGRNVGRIEGSIRHRTWYP